MVSSQNMKKQFAYNWRSSWKLAWKELFIEKYNYLFCHWFLYFERLLEWEYAHVFLKGWKKGIYGKESEYETTDLHFGN